MTSAEVPEKLKQNAESAEARKALDFLQSRARRPVGEAAAPVTVSAALRLWRTRLGNKKFTGAPLRGAEKLVHSLERRTPQSKVNQFAFAGDKTALTVFFMRSNDEFVGAVMLDKRDAQS